MSERRAVTHEAFCECQQILQGEGLDHNVRDAAQEAIEGHRSGQGVGWHAAYVLANYVASRGLQNRWGM